MQVRLTVLGPRSGRTARARDVLVTAPAGTPLGAVAGALASGAGGSGQSARASGSGPALYAGIERLDPQTTVLGMPPLLDGAVVTLHAPAEAPADLRTSSARLHVAGGPDAGGVHLLQGGRVRIGRSADADVPLDDPDVSRLHCAVTVAEDGAVTVVDLGSTNGTFMDDAMVGEHPVPFPPGAALRIGESTLRLEAAAAATTVPPPPPAALPAVPDGEGHLQVAPPGAAGYVRRSGDGPADRGREPDAHVGPAGPTDDGNDVPRLPGPDSAESAAAHRTDRLDTPRSALSGPAAPAPGDGRSGEGGVAGLIGAWARRLATGRTGRTAHSCADARRLAEEAAALRERWPDPARILLTVLGPGRRLWERGPDHPDALTLRLGTADLPAEDGSGTLRSVPFTVDLRDPHSRALGLTGPRPRLTGFARALIAQACALHSPETLEVVLISADRTRTAEQRADEWAWLNWLPHLRPAHGQDCRLLLALDPDQARARTAELARRLEEGPLGTGWATAADVAVTEAAARREGSRTLLVVDGDPGSATLRETVGRIAAAGPSVGVHLLHLAEDPGAPVTDRGVTARLTGDVATMLSVGPGQEPIVLDAVSPAWADRFARALAPLRVGDGTGPRVRSALPRTSRLLDELDLALATPAKISARWADGSGPLPTATAVLGAGPEGPVTVDLAAEGPHLLAGGAPGTGKTELLRSVAAALATAERPDRLALVLVDGGRGDGLRTVNDLPHVSSYLCADDPHRMREFAQSLGAELKRREGLLAGTDFDGWHSERRFSTHRTGPGRPSVPRQSTRADDREPSAPGSLRTQSRSEPSLPRLVVLVDDFDALVAPALGSPGRPAAGSVVRALETAARDGARLGVHLVASTGRPERTAGTETDERAGLRIALRTEDTAGAGLLVHVDGPADFDDVPGRGCLRRPDGAVTALQVGRVSGRIPRTATLRPTVIPLEWERMGDPPTRRPLRELGNGPTDLALLASALQRAAESTDSPGPRDI